MSEYLGYVSNGHMLEGMDDRRRVVVVGFFGAELLDIACVTSTLGAANVHGASPAYDVVLASLGGNPIECMTGLIVQSHAALEHLTGPLDTLIVSGGFGHAVAAENKQLVAHVRRLARESRRVASVCTGSTILAEAGLLDGRRAVTHWRWARQFAEQYPKVCVDPRPIFIRDGNISTSAGVTSALDLTLALVEEDHGSTIAREVSRSLVTYLQRPGNQAQMSTFTAAPATENRLVKRIVDHVCENLDADLSAVTLAAQSGVSERHLNRLFLAELGQTTARFIRDARTEAAANLLSSTDLPLARVAARCGFGTAETLRQAFVDKYGVSPSQFRKTQSRAS